MLVAGFSFPELDPLSLLLLGLPLVALSVGFLEPAIGGEVGVADGGVEVTMWRGSFDYRFREICSDYRKYFIMNRLPALPWKILSCLCHYQKLSYHLYRLPRTTFQIS